MNTTFKFYFECLKKALKGETVKEIPEGIDYKELFYTSTRQGVVVLLSYALKDVIDKCPTTFIEALKKAVSRETMKDIQSSFDAENVVQCFEKNGIDFLPMKGYFLKEMYPKKEMRYCSDYDILVDPKKIKQVRKLLLSLGLKMDHSDTHHDVFYFPNTKTVFEIHKLLFVGKLKKYFGIGFERAFLKEGYNHFYHLKNEDFYISVLAHYAYHFECGAGVGAKSICDLRVIRNNFNLDDEYIDSELKKCDLYTFKCQFEKLTKVVFEDDKSDEFMDKLLLHIYKSDYLINYENVPVNNTAKMDGDYAKAKKNALLKKIIPPKENIYFTYPWIKKVKLFLPLGYVLRWLRVLFKNPKKINELAKINNVDEEKVNDMRYIRNGLGL